MLVPEVNGLNELTAAIIPGMAVKLQIIHKEENHSLDALSRPAGSNFQMNNNPEEVGTLGHLLAAAHLLEFLMLLRH